MTCRLFVANQHTLLIVCAKIQLQLTRSEIQEMPESGWDATAVPRKSALDQSFSAIVAALVADAIRVSILMKISAVDRAEDRVMKKIETVMLLLLQRIVDAEEVAALVVVVLAAYFA